MKYKDPVEIMREAYHSPRSSFYKDFFSKHDFSPSVFTELKDVPVLTFDEIREYPFLKRMYSNDSVLTKVVYRNNTPCLIARSKKDILGEDYSVSGDRPVLLFDDLHDCVEKGVWFYEHNILPSAVESDADVASMVASRYGIDAIVGDSKTILRVLDAYLLRVDIGNVSHCKVIDVDFSQLESVQSIFTNAHFDVVLGISEAGTLARACLPLVGEELIFHPYPSLILEHREELLVTTLDDRSCPLIRYATGIVTEPLNNLCPCGEYESFRVINNHRL